MADIVETFVIRYHLMGREHGIVSGAARVRKRVEEGLTVADVREVLPIDGECMIRGKVLTKDDGYVWKDLVSDTMQVPLTDKKLFAAEIKVTPLFDLGPTPSSMESEPHCDFSEASWKEWRRSRGLELREPLQGPVTAKALSDASKDLAERRTSSGADVMTDVGARLGRAMGSLWSSAASLLEGANTPSETALVSLQRIRADLENPFEEGLEEHEELLEQLWRARFPGKPFSRKDPEWLQAGFTDSNPAEDLGGSGSLLGLRALAHCAEAHPRLFRRLTEMHGPSGDLEPEKRLHVAATMCQLSKELSSVVDADAPHDTWPKLSRRWWGLLEQSNGFRELTFAALVVMERRWVKAKASQRDFRDAINDIVATVKTWLAVGPNSVPRLQAIVESTEKVSLA